MFPVLSIQCPGHVSFTQPTENVFQNSPEFLCANLKFFFSSIQPSEGLLYDYVTMSVENLKQKSDVGLSKAAGNILEWQQSL
jgi:hypothetical protein